MMIRILFLLALCAVMIAPTCAAPPNDVQVTNIYTLAYGQFGGALPEKPPRIEIVTQDRLRELVGCEKCPVRGYFKEGTVYIDEALDFADLVDASVLLHEFVHYLQWVRGGDAKNCMENLAREKQAYEIQAHVLQKAGIDTRSMRFMVNALRCLPGREM